MRDLQAILFVGDPDPERLNALLELFHEDEMLTVRHCEYTGLEPSEPLSGEPASIREDDAPPLEKKDGESLSRCLDALLPDLICIFADTLPEEEALTFCGRLRDRTLKARPVLIVQSGAPEERRIQYLIQGADDILSPDLSPAEFRIRLLAHLRRNLDFSSHEVTALPALPLAAKVVHRRLKRGDKVALLTLSIDFLDVYQEAYGELPTRQVLKTCAALLGRLLIIPPDFIAHSDENHFVIVTQPEKSEKLAALICRQFDSVSPNFYSETDRKQGYMVSVISAQVSRRVPLLSLSIGIASTLTQTLRTFPSLFNASLQMCSLARMQPVSSWQGDRLRLAGMTLGGMEQSTSRPGILVLETDAALAYLLKTTLGMEGYAVEVANSVEDARAILSEKAPLRQISLLILDAVIHEEKEGGLSLAAETHRQYPSLQIICTSSLHNRQRVLQSGATLYLPRPFELSSLFLWIQRLLPEPF